MTGGNTESKSRGKKAGSTVPDRPTVDWCPPTCPHCGAVTEPTNLRYKREIVASGEYRGRAFSKVTIWSADCGACASPITVRQQEYLPDTAFAADANES